MRFTLLCKVCGKNVPFGLKTKICSCGGNLNIEYDMEIVKQTFTKESLTHRDSTMWRYAELLPLENKANIVSLGEGWTPLIPLRKAEAMLSINKIWVKREEQNPTNSFKSRGFSAAISLAKEYGVNQVAVNSNGNAASALAAYASYAGMKSYVFLPKDCPSLLVKECLEYGAHTFLVDGFIHDAGAIVKEGETLQGWHNIGTLKEHGRVEGKKTMGFEIAEQLNWKLPDVIIYPTGGGSGIVGMWSAFLELQQLGFVTGDLPRMVSVQEKGCHPLVHALESTGRFIPQTANITSTPTGMRVPNPPDGQLLVSILYQSGGTAIAVDKEEITQAQVSLGHQGISSSPEGAATFAGLLKLVEQGWISPKDEVVLFNTSCSMKYMSITHTDLPIIKTFEDWAKLSTNQ
ncbi:threonine synthase [Paenibacillus planticolens]|uniref:Threonine synthase n=1 Tax=Paenibacillus planticolens TaxID=2654976 RepID=A0ABX1ZQH8_9BACL|nr:threonine synthase [Paenibacillus planticolens]NOV02327.1 threonine synthase [Paenibacillus planticolens]